MFTWNGPEPIARSLKASAQASTNRKSTLFRSAMSMLVSYINRAGTHLDARQKDGLEQAKGEPRKLFGPN